MNRLERYAPHAARLVLGLMFLVFGLNYFFPFLPQPKEAMPASALGFLGGLMGTGYMFPLIKAIEVAAGVLLLANLLVPLALVLLAPIIVNIVLFHTVLGAPNPITFLILAAELYLAWSYRESYRALFVLRARPHTSADPAAPRRVHSRA